MTKETNTTMTDSASFKERRYAYRKAQREVTVNQQPNPVGLEHLIFRYCPEAAVMYQNKVK